MKTTRILRTLATTTAATGLLVGLTGVAAHAATPGSVSGDVNMTSCTAKPSVYVTNGTIGKILTPTQTAPGKWHYSVGDLPAGNYTVTGSVPGIIPPCPLGHWLTNPVPVAVADGASAHAPQLVFLMPTKSTPVNGNIVAAAARGKLAAIKLRLNNYGPQHGDSHQLDNSSLFATASQTKRFTIPQVSANMKLCSSTVCPSLGHAFFYVNNMNLSSVGVAWAENSTLQVSASFESAGNEVKGFYSNAAVKQSDYSMPDANIDNAKVTVSFVPRADGAGGITLVAVGVPTFAGTIQATGPCKVLGWDWCNSVSGYKAKITSALTSAALSVVNSTEFRKEISAQIQPTLNDLHIGYVTGVTVQGDNVVIASA